MLDPGRVMALPPRAVRAVLGFPDSPAPRVSGWSWAPTNALAGGSRWDRNQFTWFLEQLVMIYLDEVAL
jgi:hypothetical protein